MEAPKLSMEPIPQIAWYLQIKDEMPKSKRPLDKMPIAQIKEMYEAGFIQCDMCGKKLKITSCKYNLTEHIIHLINPHTFWSCEGCYLQDKREGRIIAEVAGSNPPNNSTNRK